MLARIDLYCPRMPIIHLSGRRYRTAVENMTATIMIVGGPTRVVPNVIIPATPVLRNLWRFPLVAKVAACVGKDARDEVVSELPEEDVRWELFGLVAKQMIAPTTWRNPQDGSTWTGDVTYPDCPVSLFGGGAQELTASGTLVKQDKYNS